MLKQSYFYYLKDEFFVKFQNEKLSQNKGDNHNRPCFFSFTNDNKIFWFVPVSSQVEKYKKIYNQKIIKNGFCDTLVFGLLKSKERVFLIQNMFPATINYIDKIYMNEEDNTPVKISHYLEQNIILKSIKILRLTRKGAKLVFPDILKMEKILIEELNK